MKAEHRKELHTNVLADRMGRLVKGMKSPSSTPAALWVIGGLTLVLLVCWATARGVHQVLWMENPGLSNAKLWVEVEGNTYTKDESSADRAFQELAQKAPRTLPGRTARFQRARLLLPLGLQNLPTELRDNAAKQLKEARTLYQELAGECKDEPLLRQEALLGAARAEESLAGVSRDDEPEKAVGNLDEALAMYKKAADANPDTYVGKQAGDAARRLEDKTSRASVETFYDDLRRGAAFKRP